MLQIEDIREILGRIEIGEWWIHLSESGSRPWLQIRFQAPDLVTREIEEQHGRKWMLSPHMTKSEVVNTAFKAYLAAVEHEAREAFRYDGACIYGPHFDVDKMAHFVRSRDNIDVRTGEWVTS